MQSKKYFLQIIIIFTIIYSSFSQENRFFIPNLPISFFSDINIPGITEFIKAEKIVIADSACPQLFSRMIFNNLYREKKGNSLRREIYSLSQINGFRLPLEIKNRQFFTGVYTQTNIYRIKYDFNDAETFKFQNENNKNGFFLSTPILYNRFFFFGDIGRQKLNQSIYYPYSIGCTLQPVYFIVLIYQLKQNFTSRDFEFYYYDSPFTFRWFEQNLINKLKLQLYIQQWLKVTIDFKNNSINHNGSNEKDEKLLLLKGKDDFWTIEACSKILENISFKFKYIRQNMDLSGRFYYQNISFGKITEFYYLDESFLAGMDFKRKSGSIFTNFSWGKGKFNFRGHVESWPFTSIWIDLIGLRYYFKSNLGYYFKRLELGYRYNQSKFFADFILNFERLNPDGKSKSWEPQFLVFGQKNVKNYEVNLLRQDGVYLTVNAGKTLKRITLSYQFTQYIPLWSKKKSSEKVTPSSTEKEKPQRSIYGGGRHVINFIFSF